GAPRRCRVDAPVADRGHRRGDARRVAGIRQPPLAVTSQPRPAPKPSPGCSPSLPIATFHWRCVLATKRPGGAPPPPKDVVKRLVDLERPHAGRTSCRSTA